MQISDEAYQCPVCLVEIKTGDLCSTDIELGTCHAACLEGSPTVNLETGVPIDGPIPTFVYQAEATPEQRARAAYHHDTVEEIMREDALRAALSLPVQPVAVKQMEWYPDPGAFPYNTWGAQSSFGRFTIEEVSASDSPAYEARYTPHHLIAIKDSLEDAKAAAQADYEYRIRSALTCSAPRAKEVERVILQKRPRAFIIEYASGEYDIFRDEGLAATKAEENGVEYHGLYRRTTPPVPPTKGPEDEKPDRFAYWNSLPESEKAKIRQSFHDDMFGGSDD